jgi:hypothetical protein
MLLTQQELDELTIKSFKPSRHIDAAMAAIDAVLGNESGEVRVNRPSR